LPKKLSFKFKGLKEVFYQSFVKDFTIIKKIENILIIILLNWGRDTFLLIEVTLIIILHPSSKKN